MTKTKNLNHRYFWRLLIRERDTCLNDQLDKPRLRLYALQHQKVYWSDKLTFAVWELAPTDHLKHFVFISLLSLDINVKYNKIDTITSVHKLNSKIPFRDNHLAQLHIKQHTNIAILVEYVFIFPNCILYAFLFWSRYNIIFAFQYDVTRLDINVQWRFLKTHKSH